MFALTYLAMGLFPLLSMMIFLRFGMQRGIVWTAMLGFLFLPVRPTFDPPLLPTIDRRTLTITCVVVFAALMAKGRGWRADKSDYTANSWLPKSKLFTLLIILAVFSSIGTYFTNRDSGHTPHGYLFTFELLDIGRMSYEIMFPALLLIVGRRFLSDEKGIYCLLKAAGFTGVIYGLLIVFEWRMSPVLKLWVYGIYDIDWGLVAREYGFRPVVFLENGLQTAIFHAMACVSAVAVFRGSTGGDRTLWRSIALFNLACLPFTQSAAAIILGFAFSALAFFGTKKLILMAVASVAFVSMTYPVTRTLDVVPTQTLLSAASIISERRAGSLRTRFTSEDRYLVRAKNRPYFGWGQRIREMPRDSRDRPAATPDGFWVIMVAQRGLIGFAAIFGLFTLPLMLLWVKRRIAPIDHAVLGLGVVVSVAVADNLLNASFTPMLWLCSGILLGISERVLYREADQAAIERRSALELERRKRRGETVLAGSHSGTVLATARDGAKRHGLEHARR
ncbi:MAG: hypothetical protein AAFR84_21605 [Pseudomonadota bacterium]